MTVAVVDVLPDRPSGAAGRALLDGPNSSSPPGDPALLAWAADELVGMATYAIGEGDCELLILHAGTRFAGTRSALLTAVQEVAVRGACTRRWVAITKRQ